jgi:hypothetical protein
MYFATSCGFELCLKFKLNLDILVVIILLFKAAKGERRGTLRTTSVGDEKADGETGRKDERRRDGARESLRDSAAPPAAEPRSLRERERL